MPVPPAVSCASDRASAPRLATVQKRREVGHCFNVRKVARCFCRRQKCAYEGGMAIHRFFAAEKPRDGAGARSACFPPSSKAFATALCALPQGFCSLRNYKTGGFPLCVCMVWAGKVENSFSQVFYCGSFPDSFDNATAKRETVCSVVKGVCSRPRVFCSRVFALCGITKRAVFPVGNGGGVQNSRQKAKSWSKVRANCRNRAQNY